jgi:2-polyprenyl-3-methyl-5-hydroxy-6-metoxy-1,4-benzoquinol methylase
MLDVGCGYHAHLTEGFHSKFERVYLADVSLNPNLKTNNRGNIVCIEGSVESSLKVIEDQSMDLIVANNILEHLEKPELLLSELRRLISKEGLIYINVPSWRGKFFLELTAFKLGLAPVEEMQDHKNYYSKNELWTLLRKGNFNPRAISVKSKKFGLNSTALINMKKN